MIEKSVVLVTILSLFAVFPQQSWQLNLQASCVYNYNSENVYICDIVSPMYANSNDTLEIGGTHLEGLTDADVLAVNYHSNVTAYFNGEVLKKFENLKILNFYVNELFKVNLNAFDVCPNLEEFQGYLTSLPSKMLNNCKNLKVFDIFAYKLEEIPEDLFGAANNLQHFRLSSTKLSTLPEKLLQNMRNLTIFDVNGNELSELHPNFLINAVNLEDVNLSFNYFVDQQKLTFALNGHPNLKRLNLATNYYSSFDFRFFAQFQKLERLLIGTLAYNLTEISWQSLPSSLTELFVRGILEEIPANSFERLENLKILSLSGSGITDLHKDTFKGLEGLETLAVTVTSIITLHPEIFNGLSNLRSLDLGFNPIKYLPAGVFAPLVNLGLDNDYRGLEMIYNRLERLNKDHFGDHPHLRYLQFYSNYINEIEHGVFRKFHPNLTRVDFSYNKCVNKSFSGEKLDDNEAFSLCHKNWNEIIPTTPVTEPSTTPGAAGSNFKRFEIIFITFVGTVGFLINSFV